MRRDVGIVFLIAVMAVSVQAAQFNVRYFGARGDGTTVDSPAINKAIEAAAAEGGGTVVFPAGTYLSYSIRLRSHVGLFLDHGCVILAAEPTEDQGYDAPEPNPWGDEYRYQDFGHSHWHDSLIWGEHLEDISITGPGLIHGKGLRRWDTRRAGDGNKAVALKQCRNVVIRDVTFLMGGHFCILPTGVDNFTIDNVKIDTNRDGINIDCCKNVRISNCTINSPNDDAIVLKSSYALGVARATENVTISNCQVTGYNLGSFLDGTFKRTQDHAPDRGGVTGRIKFGTESNGGFKNITITNCVFERCRGLALETVDGGILEDITISNITMRDIVNAPIFICLGGRMRGPEDVPVGKLRRVKIMNLTVFNADPRYASLITGIPGHAIEDVTLSHVQILVKGGAPAEQANVTVPMRERAYPDPREFGLMPAYGFFVRHVKGITFDHVKVGFMEADARPAFVLDAVDDAAFHFVEAQNTEGGPRFKLNNVRTFEVFQCDGVDNQTVTQADEKML
ncbi:MAG: right-handed parallel beta-helix repeat-containing protein [Phycisphaerae bacterium]|nr:right-handed parallel beta-helix repeat-containing protein [Phycisphaerae bacterium]